MGGISKMGFGRQLLLAGFILLVTWMVLRWVIRVFFAVATTIVVIGALIVAAWFFVGRSTSD